MTNKLILFSIIFFSLSIVLSAKQVNPTGNVTFSDIRVLVEYQNRDVKEKFKNLESQRALVRQSGVLPNPEFEIESENILGEGDNTGFKSAETTAKIESLFELGFKRHKRLKVVQINESIASLDYETSLTQAVSNALNLAIDALKQQELISIEAERLQTNLKFASEIRKRVKSGRLSIVEQKRAKILVSKSRLSLKKTELELKQSFDQLSLAWGFSESLFSKILGDIYQLAPLPEWRTLSDRLSNNLELRKSESEIELASAQLDIERSLGWPDLVVGTGVKHDNSSDDTSFVLSAGFPIPIFDRNSGASQAAKHDHLKSKVVYKNLESKLNVRLKNTFDQLVLLEAELKSLKKDIIPQAKEVFLDLKDGYLKGKYSYLEVLEAQNSLFDFRAHYLEVLAQYHQLINTTKELTGSILIGENQ